MTRRLRIYLPFAANALKAMLAYKVSSIAYMISTYVVVLAQYFIWRAVYLSSGAERLQGMTFQEMRAYLCIAVIMAEATSSYASERLGSSVVDGSIAMSLLKPMSMSARIFFEELGPKGYSLFTVFIPMLLVAYLSIKLPFDPLALAQFFVSLSLGLIINFYFNMCFGMLAFCTTYIFGLRIAKESVLSFLSGFLLPIPFFPAWAQSIMKFLPFQYMNYVPAATLLGIEQNFLFVCAIQLAWVAILFALSKALWSQAIKRLTILGG
jgi:ABC-2 type transport system permease protein